MGAMKRVEKERQEAAAEQQRENALRQFLRDFGERNTKTNAELEQMTLAELRALAAELRAADWKKVSEKEAERQTAEFSARLNKVFACVEECAMALRKIPESDRETAIRQVCDAMRMAPYPHKKER